MSEIGFLRSASRVLPNPPRITRPIAVHPAVPNLVLNTAAGDGGDSFISLLIPSCGTTSGGEQIVLVVVNLPPSITLFARFGDNVVPTVRCKCPKVRGQSNHSLVSPRSWRSHLSPTSSRPTRYSRGDPLANALSHCTHLRDTTDQVHIRIRCHQSVRLHLLRPYKCIDQLLVSHIFSKFPTRRFVWKLCLSFNEYSRHMGIVVQLALCHKQVPVAKVQDRYDRHRICMPPSSQL
jgi:hypothetical protein